MPVVVGVAGALTALIATPICAQPADSARAHDIVTDAAPASVEPSAVRLPVKSSMFQALVWPPPGDGGEDAMPLTRESTTTSSVAPLTLTLGDRFPLPPVAEAA